MALPASSLLELLLAVRRNLAEERVVTAHAILLNHIAPSLMHDNCLRLPAQRKYRCMPHAVPGLKRILPEKVVLRDMAVIARCGFGMRAVQPGVILGDHDMAVDADPGVVRDIGKSIGCI